MSAGPFFVSGEFVGPGRTKTLLQCSPEVPFRGRVTGGGTESRFFVVTIAPPDSGPAENGDYYVQGEVDRGSFSLTLTLNGYGFFYTQPEPVRVYEATGTAAIRLAGLVNDDPDAREHLSRSQFFGLTPSVQNAGGIQIDRRQPADPCTGG